jgi:hypothetical protein
VKNIPNKPSQSRKKRFQLSSHSLAESKNTMDLLGEHFFPLPIAEIHTEPDEFEQFILKAQQFSAQNFLEKAEQSVISSQSEALIHNSVAPQPELISETLADLLAKQGKNKQAAKMYQKLATQQPDKDDIFQLKIKQLKK